MAFCAFWLLRAGPASSQGGDYTWECGIARIIADSIIGVERCDAHAGVTN
jgi:hypothetical protein